MLAAACMAWLALVWLWRPAVFAMPVDDSFYYLVTAQNVAAGAGTTFDRINPTNGFHPLWLAALAGLFSLVRAPVDTLVRLVLSLQVVMVYAGTRLLARVPSLEGSRIQPVIALLLVNPYVAKVFVNCQESALQYLLLAGALWGWWRLEREAAGGPGRHLAIGLLAGLVVLARLEALFFATALAAMPLIWPEAADENRGAGRGLAASLWRALGTAALVAPYLAWNLVGFGHLLPVSGAIKHEAGGGLAPAGIALVAAAAAGVLLAVAAAGRRAARVDVQSAVRFAFPLLAYVTMLEAYHLAFRSSAGLQHVRLWYLVPHVALVAVAACCALATVTGRKARTTAAVGAAVFLVASAVPAWAYRLDPRSWAVYREGAEAGQWLRSHARPDAVAAGWDVGYVSGFSGLRVMSLDGLINSWDFKERYLETGRVEEFVTKAHPVDYVTQSIRPQTIAQLAARLRGGDAGAEAGDPRAGRSAARSDLGRWTPALLEFTVVRATEFDARFAYRPDGVVHGMVFLVLSRVPQAGLPTLAQFVLTHSGGGRNEGPA